MDMLFVGSTEAKKDAEKCLEYAKEIAHKYGFCSLADLLASLDCESNYIDDMVEFTIEQLNGAVIKQVKHRGYCEIYIPVEDVCDLQKTFRIRNNTTKSTKSTTPHIDIFMNRGHWVATIDDKFFCTGDNFTEVTAELENYMNRKED